MRGERRRGWGAPDCPRFREAVSARLDGEDPGMPDEIVDGHLARCPECARFAEMAAREHRRLRVRPAGPVPDLTGEILQRLATVPDPSPVGNGGARRGRRVASTAAVVGGRGRRRVASIAAAAVVVVGGGFGAGALLGDHLGPGAPAAPVAVRQVAGSSQTSSRYPGATLLAVGVRKPAVVLTDTSGRPYDLARATAGKVTLVYFGYTHCPDLCPINMALTASALRDLPASEQRAITVVFITTDPARDTRQVIRAWLNRFDPSFVGLTGSVAAIHAAEVQVQMPLSYAEADPARRAAPSGGKGQDYPVVHAGYTLVYAPDGRANLTVEDSARPDQFAVTLAHVLTYGFRGSS